MLEAVDWLRHQLRLRRWNADRAWGRRGEDLAHRFLRRQGYVIVARNYRTRSAAGEVDLIAWHKDTLVFVEVKTRATADVSAPERAVDLEKQRRLIIAARDYTRRARVDWERTRFDIVSIVLLPKPRVELIEDAFPRSVAAVA